ncbi:TRAP transporter substrate-binding protein DctP [Anaeromicropila herbilytica]|uniref:C4-dicarboxylate ABC transporter n=1 Tax=Anaeromicropila herbilytica TaxID=2785025 RepID=A0A7R7EPH7_9FIRM|nr:TRAP transporter substrate-binding protein DctP [Anaeromicropila herbilytica]BCN32592.1 C4-dicarboxylate ABC transporter [Anaeromicropila herbilytica]
MYKELTAVLLMMTMMVVLCSCQSKPVTTLIMTDVQQNDHPTALSSDKFASLVEEKTHGQVKIEVYHGSALGSEAEQSQQIATGGIDFARLSTSVLASYDDSLKAFQGLFVFSSDSQMWNVLNGDVGNQFLASDKLLSNGIEPLCWFSGGTRNFYNSEKEIKSPSDFNGLKLRVNTDSLFSFLTKCGASGTNIAYNDVYNSIQNGVVKGAENNWPSYISTEHYKVAKYITLDGHMSVPEMIVASKSSMDKLTKSQQKIIAECAKEASIYQKKAMISYETKAIKEAKKAGCTVTELSSSEKDEFKQIGDQVNQEVFADYQDIIQAIKAVK